MAKERVDGRDRAATGGSGFIIQRAAPSSELEKYSTA